MARKIRNEFEYSNDIIEDYISSIDWRIKENSNVGFSIGGLILHNSGAITANYWLNNVYTNEIAEAHKNASFHIHDLSMLSGYCFEKDVKFLLADETEMSFEEAEKMGIKEIDIISYNKNTGKKEIKKARDIGIKGVDDLYQIELDDGTIIKGFTKWHEVVTKNRGLVRFDELTSEDEIIEF